MLERFLQTKKKKYVHFAVDIMIFFQCGLRLPSSLAKLEENILKLLERRTKDPSVCRFTTTQTKTNSKAFVNFDEQLLQLLEKLAWKGFALPKKEYERLTTILPFSLYTLRRGFISFLYVKHEQTKDIRFLTQHKSSAY